MSQLARHLLLWSLKHLRSLRATHIPGLLNRAANKLSRAAPPESGDSIPRRSADLETFRTCTGRPVCIPRDFSFPVVLLPVRENTRHGMRWHTACHGACASMFQTQWAFSHRHCARSGRMRSRSCSWPQIGHSDLVPRADAPRDSPSLVDSSEEGNTDSEMRHLVAPASRPLETSCLKFPERDAEVPGDLPQEVVNTITSARAPSTRHAYTLKWNLFIEWCSSQEVSDQSRTVLFAARVGAKAVSLHP